jgi:hypothetical protein
MQIDDQADPTLRRRPRRMLIQDLVRDERRRLLRARTVAVTLHSALRMFRPSSEGTSHEAATVQQRWLERASALVQDVRAQSTRARDAMRTHRATGAATADEAELRALTQKADRVVAAAESDVDRLRRRIQPGKRPRTHSTTRPIPLEKDGPTV